MYTYMYEYIMHNMYLTMYRFIMILRLEALLLQVFADVVRYLCE